MLLLMTTLIFFTDLQKVWCKNDKEYENFCMEFTSVSREIELDDETLTQDNNQAITMSVTSLSQRYSTDLSILEPTTKLVDVETHNVMCKTTAEADIVLLVDGSWSVGRINFKTIRSFIARLVGIFDIGPDRVQIGLIQYSGDPRIEWHVNAHRTRHSLLEAVANISYKGGNTMTGDTLKYILNNFKAIFGMRPNSQKIAILITDGKSQDDVSVSSQSLHNSGIELYAIGVMNADVNDLCIIASDPDETHVYKVKDFSSLWDIVEKLTRNLCSSIKGQGL